MGHRKYILDLNDLQFKLVRHPWERKLLHWLLWLSGSVAVTLFYSMLFHHLFGSPKEKVLTQQIENMRLKYALASRQIETAFAEMQDLKESDEIRYRPVLSLESLPGSIRNPGFGGVERFNDLNGYASTSMMKNTRIRIEELKNMATVQNESFNLIGERSADWKRELDHLPAISPVDPSFPLGDRYGFRQMHPVLGVGRMHYGQDFKVPYNTRVYATGDGKVIESGWNSGGFGNIVIIDHGYGLQTIYAHLSKINVPKDMNVKRGDLIGLSGSTGSLSTGPHLHYQIMKYGSPVNAMDFFNNDVTEEEFQEMIQAFGSKSLYR